MMNKIVAALMIMSLLLHPNTASAGDFRALYALKVLSIDLLVNHLEEVGTSDPAEMRTLLEERRRLQKRIRAYREYIPLRRFVRISRESIMEIVREKAKRQGLEPLFILAMIKNESAFDPRALSRSGAMGLMQLMPETSRELLIDDPWDPEKNIDGGVRYFRKQLEDFKDVKLALAAYNWGPHNVRKVSGKKFPKETRDYIRRVIQDYHRYKR